MHALGRGYSQSNAQNRPSPARGHGHRPSSSRGASISGRTAELTSAYASLASELTRKEIKAVGAYTIGRVIGEGSFGKVHIGIHRLTNTRVAIKQVPKSLPFSSDPSSPLSLLTREIHHHRRLRHPHLLALYELIATESSIYLVSELCTGGELFDYLVEKGRLTVSETRRIFGQLVLGVAHLHKMGVVHRDLKLENVLLDERVNVKIADLGFGREFEKGRWMDTWVGSLGYSAPEMVGAKRYLGEEVDIWSLGVILFTLMTGSLPFDDDDEGVMKQKILTVDLDVPTWLDDDAADLIRGILQLDPFRRLTLKQILSHTFFTRPPSSSDDCLPQSHGSSQTISVIPEETASNPSPPVQHDHHTSEVSDTSFFSASDSDAAHSGFGERLSRSTTPTTSDDDGGLSAVKAGKQRAIDLESGSQREPPMSWLHRNHSETTIRKDKASSEAGDESAASSSTEATPRGSVTASRRRGILPTSTEEDEDDERSLANARFANHLGLSAPNLQRNISSSSASSFHSQGGSPVAVHTRTPSRTKRHSVGSIFSERLFSLDEEPSPIAGLSATARVDYLSLMTEEVPEPLSTKEEKKLLDDLTTLGFDTGQMVHSVRTDACDSSAAMWFMLKRKADEREREKVFEDEDEEDETAQVLDKPEMSKAGAIAKDGERVPLTASPTPALVVLRADSSSTSSRASSQERAGSVATPDSTDQLDYFASHTRTATAGSKSAPLLQYFEESNSGTASPTLMKSTSDLRSKSRDYLTASSPPSTPPMRSPSLNLLPEPLASPKSGSGTELSSSESSMGKRMRSSSVSMLQRATSAIGTALKKPLADDGGTKSSEDSSRVSTPTLSSLFTRKGSLPDDGRVMTPPSSPSRRPISELSTSNAGGPPVTPRRKSIPLASSVTSSASPAVSNSDSHDTFDTIESSAASSTSARPSASNTPTSKKSGKGNLFSNFKMWFGDDRRKRKRQPIPFSHVENSASLRTTTLRRGAPGVRADGTYVNSPLKRPPLGSRRSSQGSFVAPPSRRSSINSISRQRTREAGLVSSPNVGHRRRQSDGSRASTSDLEPSSSRPPSIRSISGHGLENTPRRTGHHSKSNSISSSTSFRPHIPVQAKDVYRRPPTSTTVRRHHGSATRHSRNRSGGSSVTRHSSNSSIGAEDVDEMLGESNGAEPILEEDETGAEERSILDPPMLIDEVSKPRTSLEEERAGQERNIALRKLSGNFSLPSAPEPESLPHGRHRRSSSGDLHHSRGSKTSLDSRHNGSSPVVFAAHKTRHVFGAPSQPVPAGSTGRRSNHHSTKPALRDVFASKEGDDDWVDETDEYCGGLGQASSRSGLRTGEGTSANTSPTSTSFPAGSLPSMLSSGQSEDSRASTSNMFESRYAGVMGGSQPNSDGAEGSWSRPPAFRSAVVIEEEEEEEE